MRLWPFGILLVVAASEASALPLSAWVGTWVDPSNPYGSAIEITKRGRHLHVEGSTFWALSQEAAERGGINAANIADDLNPHGSSAQLSSDDGCKIDIHFKRRGALLIVTDRGNCGGMNTNFSGSYRRERHKTSAP